VFLAKDWTSRAREFTTSSGSLERRAAELVDLSTFVTPAPSEALVRETVSLARVRAAHVALKVTTTRWRSGTLRLFSNADFTDTAGPSILLASGAIPGIFRANHRLLSRPPSRPQPFRYRTGPTRGREMAVRRCRT
jgi:predicted acylesterase/phospholipase RssA